YLAYQSPHNPLQAPREDIMKYRGRYLKGWMAIRQARIKNQIKFGILDKNAALPAYPLNLPDWDSLSPEQKDLEDLRMSVYAAMVERMDNGIGKLMKALQQNGQDKNTLILFLSDNGNDPFTSTDAAMLRQGLLPGDAGSNWQIGMGWAFAGVTPWRLYKISQHSGGVMTGAIAWWPSGIKEQGKVIKSSLHVVDVMPTLLNIVAANRATYASLAGETFLPLLQGKKWQRKGPMFFQFVDNRSVKTNRWNLVEVDGNGWELYDVQKDFFETKDLARQHPEIVKELEAKWLNWWMTDGNTKTYKPESTKTGPHYFPQGDRGSGKIYIPTPMPESLSKKYKN
ncbi:MAG TPA: sulfatase-like hydrolase/transferase, partial [Candidatus Saccharimonadales bacterium]|nr:sulfatase-like hydrolase/transferase [Candidatus Saccharimonadales bacterium]